MKKIILSILICLPAVSFADFCSDSGGVLNSPDGTYKFANLALCSKTHDEVIKCETNNYEAQKRDKEKFVRTDCGQLIKKLVGNAPSEVKKIK